MKLYKNLTTAMKEREEVRAIKLSLKEIFPKELFDLTELEEVYLDGSCKAFPDEIPGWKMVKVLSIKWDNFQGDLSPVFSLPKLENLKIIETPITSFRLPLGTVAAPLKFLSIKGCGLKILPEEISMLTELTEFHIPNNELITLPFSFRELKKLKRLNLDSNNFEVFPDFIKKMSQLGHLSIDNNAFSEDEKDRIQREFHIWPT
jgi:Leucine-rich repeat (LRR) protein